MAGVIAERDGRAVGRADAAVRAEDQEFLAAELRRIPAHAGVLRPAEQVAGGPLRAASRRVMGSEPCGPGALERTSKTAGRRNRVICSKEMGMGKFILAPR